CQQESNWPTY
nr:immunoglobulin light chain junction region [Macaca mulatta]